MGLLLKPLGGQVFIQLTGRCPKSVHTHLYTHIKEGLLKRAYKAAHFGQVDETLALS
jgi:hypothetical protein